MTPTAFFIDMLSQDPVFYLSVIVAVVISVVLHELGHALAAIWQGDDTPRIAGHLTWNPMVHMGGLSLVLLVVAGIAFGQTPVNPNRFRDRYGRSYVAAAGPLVNVLLAAIGLTSFALWVNLDGMHLEGVGHVLQQFLYLFGLINIVLALFNLLPIPPLDGSSILADLSPAFARLKRNPDNQPFFLGAFLLVIFFAGSLFTAGRAVAEAFLGVLWDG